MSTVSKSSDGPIRKRAPQIGRGRACAVCRRRKIRCDGQRPICIQCIGGPYESECEYTDSTPSRSRLLEERIETLNRRIQDLESSPQSSTSTAIQDVSQPLNTVSSSQEEPPAFIIGTLLHAFFHMSTEVIFFLNWQRFRDGAMLQLPMGNYSRPLPALLYTVYLWGTHMSGDDFITSLKPALLEQCVLRLRNPEEDHPDRVMHTLQAQLLLAHYLLCVGRVAEGKEYLRATIDFCFGCGLNQHPSGDDEQGRALWAVFVVNNTWSAGLSFQSLISYNDPSRRIDTAWPMTVSLAESQPGTVVRYLQGQEIGGVRSALTLHAQASVLFERASHLYAQSPNVHSNIIHTNTPAFTTLHHLILELCSQLPTLDQMKQESGPTLTSVTHTLAHAAIIQLHRKFIGIRLESLQAVFFAAKEIIEWAAGLENAFTVHLSAFCAVPWRLACEIMVLFGANSSWAALVNAEETRHNIELGMAAMAKLCTCPLMLRQYTILRDAVGEHVGSE